MNIALVKLSSIGDVVHALPVAAALRASLPQAHLTWIVERREAAVLRGNAALSEIVPVDTRGWRRVRTVLSIAEATGALVALGRHLRASRFDVAIDLQGLVKSGVITAATRAPLRIGFVAAHCRESASTLFTNQRVSPADVRNFLDTPLYASNVVRTFFLEFESADWEKELEDFHGTDVDVPARLTVDGKSYPDVGVHFRGASSYFTVGSGRKRSLNLSQNARHADQRVGGYRTLNLLNSHEDPSFLRSVLSYQIACEYLAKIRSLYEKLGETEQWTSYIAWLRKQHSRLHTLKEELAAAGL